MSMDGGISIGGGAGGIDPSKAGEGIKKGMADLGKAADADVDQFKQSFSGGGTQGPSQTQQASSPFQTQSNRITDSSMVQKSGGSDSLGKTLMDDVSNITKIGKAQNEALTDKLKEVGSKGWDASDAMEFQYMAGEMQLMTEIVSKGVNKVVTAAQTLARNQ